MKTDPFTAERLKLFRELSGEEIDKNCERGTSISVAQDYLADWCETVGHMVESQIRVDDGGIYKLEVCKHCFMVLEKRKLTDKEFQQYRKEMKEKWKGGSHGN